MLAFDERAARARAALEDVVAIEDAAPGMVTVVTISDAYVVDARHERCGCPDQEYHLDDADRCKHVWAALAATDQLAIPGQPIADDLDEGPDPLPDFGEFDPGTEYV